jgi:hypothetical protein
VLRGHDRWLDERGDAGALAPGDFLPEADRFFRVPPCHAVLGRIAINVQITDSIPGSGEKSLIH